MNAYSCTRTYTHARGRLLCSVCWQFHRWFAMRLFVLSIRAVSLWSRDTFQPCMYEYAFVSAPGPLICPQMALMSALTILCTWMLRIYVHIEFIRFSWSKTIYHRDGKLFMDVSDLICFRQIYSITHTSVNARLGLHSRRIVGHSVTLCSSDFCITNSTRNPMTLYFDIFIWCAVPSRSVHLRLSFRLCFLRLLGFLCSVIWYRFNWFQFCSSGGPRKQNEKPKNGAPAKWADYRYSAMDGAVHFFFADKNFVNVLFRVALSARVCIRVFSVFSTQYYILFRSVAFSFDSVQHMWFAHMLENGFSDDLNLHFNV